jgi:pilus assembly protein FimV
MEIQAQLSALSEQVGTLRELVVVKDQQIAALEAQLAAQKRQPTAAPPASVSQVAPAPSSVDSGYPWWLFALGGVALLAIGAVVYTRRLQRPVMVLKRTSPSVELEPAVSRPNELEIGDLPDQADSPGGADGERGYGQRLHNDYVEEGAVADAVAEADIYVAYGRYQQALNLLDAAAQTNPDDPAAVVKMVEIYLKNDRLEEARHAAQRLEGLGDGSAFGEASRMISDAESKADSGLDLGELAEPAGGSQSGNLDRLDAVDATPVLDLDLDLGVASSASAAGVTELESTGADLSLGVDLTMPDESVQQEPELPAELAEVLGNEGSSLASEDSDGEDALVYAEDVDPIDTQLDLARAYIDMGDEDGARPVLNEVIAAGDLRQQAEARELLVSID